MFGKFAKKNQNVILKRIDFFYIFIYNGNNKKNMLNIIVDPKAGKGLAVKNVKQVSKYLKKEKIPYLVYFIEKDSDVSQFAIGLTKSGETDFVFLSDDDVIHTFLNNNLEINKLNIGIIPSGRYNNFAKSLNLEFNPTKAIQNILMNNLEQFDYIKCNDKIALNYLAFGAVESYENRETEEKVKKNLTFMKKLKALKNYEPIQINFSGKEVKEKNIVIKECYIANGVFKDNLRVSPLSNLQDGLCNIVCITSKEGSSPIREMLSIKRAKHIYNEENKIFWATQFGLSASSFPLSIKIDGLFYSFNELSINVIEGGLNIYLPN